MIFEYEDPLETAILTTHCKRRLRSLELALRSDNLKRRNFNLHTWANKKPEKNLCSTQACAIGLATTIPSWQKDGFGLFIESGGYITPSYGGFYADNAIEKYLEISGPEVDYLFMPSSYRETKRGPITVANRINKFINARS